MNPLKQALREYKISWRTCAFLSPASLLLMFAAKGIPYLGGLFFALGLIVLQVMTTELMRGKNATQITHIYKTNKLTVAIVGCILFPTAFLSGLAYDTLHSGQGLLQSLPTALSLYLVCIFYFLLMSHAVLFSIKSSQSIVKSIDMTAVATFKYFKQYLAWSFYLALALSLASLTNAIGVAIVLPLLLFTVHFSFCEMEKSDSLRRI